MSFPERSSLLTAQVPTDIPASLTAGDTWQWTKYVNDYSAADGWILTYYLSGPGLTQTIVATTDTDGVGFSVTVPATTTAPLVAGVRQYIARVALAGAVHTVDSGTVVVLPNVATATSGQMQSVAEQMVALIEQALLAQAATAANGGTGGVIQSYSIGTRSVTYRDEADLRAQLSHWKWKVWAEQHPGQIGPKRSVRFVG